tara:strand:+ start:1869 stop:2054 length:186 start_codon:yes stop_codon:yes gene_type:complete
LSLLTFAVASFAAPPAVTVKGPAKWVQCLAFSPDGKRVVAGNDEFGFAAMENKMHVHDLIA